MTDPFFHTRAAEIIAAYGGDPARWPDAERVTALAVIAADPELVAAQSRAAILDADFVIWAQTPVAPGNATAAAQIAMRRPRPFLRWAAGTGIAAALVAGLFVVNPVRTPVPHPQIAAALDEPTFAQVFTPTPDEEQVL
jgi:hypothetical protein